MVSDRGPHRPVLLVRGSGPRQAPCLHHRPGDMSHFLPHYFALYIEREDLQEN